MKFQRTDLIDRVRAEIDRRVLAAEAANAKAREKVEKERQAYIESTATAWGVFAGNIAAALRERRPVTTDDCPNALKDGWLDRIPLRPAHRWDPPADRVPDTAALATLLDLLEAATDDEISTTSLERMGFRMAQLFRGR